MEPRDVYSMGRQNWFDAVGEEHAHVREQVGIFDQSSFAKFELSGADAAAALDWICANDVTKPVGRLTYTQLLNTRGGIEADLTVARLAEDRFYIVTGTGFRTHDLAWIADHLPTGDAALTDVTERLGHAVADGPARRATCWPRWSRCRRLERCLPVRPCPRDRRSPGTTVRALRITYVGELGWELHVPLDRIGAVFDALMAAGHAERIRPVGYRALEIAAAGKRLPRLVVRHHAQRHAVRGRAWAGRSSCAATPPFSGARRWTAAQGEPLTKRFAGFTLDDPDAVLLGRETILRDGEPVGYLTSGGYGYTVGRSIGYGYVRNADGVDRRVPRVRAHTNWWSPTRRYPGRRSGCGRSTTRRMLRVKA